MDNIERTLQAMNADPEREFRVLLGSLGTFLAFKDEPGIAYGLDPEGTLLRVPYTQSTELVE